MEPINTGWVKLHHSSGALVTLPVTVEPLDYRAMFANVGRMIEAGFLVAAPGLEAGEEKEEIGWVLKGEKGDGTPYVLLYVNHERMTHSVLKVYLNNFEDVQAFEAASGMKLDAMPTYEGADKPERGKNPKVDAKYLVKAKRPFFVVYKDNPKFDQAASEAARAKNEVYKVPKRLFLRWASDNAAKAQPEQPDEVQAWREWLASTATDPETLTSVLPDLAKMDRQLKEQVWHLFKIHADTKGWEFDREAKRFVRAK